MRSEAGAFGALFRGVHAVDWGLPASEPVMPGMLWRWSGQAMRLDRGAQALWLGRPLGRPDHRSRARSRLARLALTPPAPPDAQLDPEARLPDDAPPGGLVLTDGRHLYSARLVPAPACVVIVFDPWLPPPDTDLWVTACAPAPASERPPALGGIAAGARIDTPDGPRAVETLGPGDLVLTRDHGAQPLLWVGETRLSGAELILHQHLRPLRLLPAALAPGQPSAPLRLAPGHRLVVPGLPGIHHDPEALAMAADLEDGHRIRRDLSCTSVVYVHLMLPRHEIVRIEGMDCETFHPGLADPVALRWHARGLERAVPGVTSSPHRFGEPARRCLTMAEAALLAAA